MTLANLGTDDDPRLAGPGHGGRATGQRETRPLSTAGTRGGRPRSWGASARSGCSARTSPRSPAAARPAGSENHRLDHPVPRGAHNAPGQRPGLFADFEQLVAAHDAVLLGPDRADEPRRVGRWVAGASGSRASSTPSKTSLAWNATAAAPCPEWWSGSRNASLWPRRSGGTGDRRARQALLGRLRPLGPHPPAGRPARRDGGRDPRRHAGQAEPVAVRGATPRTGPLLLVWDQRPLQGVGPAAGGVRLAVAGTGNRRRRAGPGAAAVTPSGGAVDCC
jgi:hypothetical protein